MEAYALPFGRLLAAWQRPCKSGLGLPIKPAGESLLVWSYLNGSPRWGSHARMIALQVLSHSLMDLDPYRG